MRVALTVLSGRRRPTNSPRKSWLAAISLSYKQPKTHFEVGTKKPGRSTIVDSLTCRGTKNRSGDVTWHENRQPWSIVALYTKDLRLSSRERTYEDLARLLWSVGFNLCLRFGIQAAPQ